jgi:hypothetical protein
MNQEAIVLTRRQVGQWASYLAGSALLLGFIGWLWQGGFTTIVGIALGIGLVSLLVWIVVAPGDFVNFISGRQIRRGTVAVFSTLLLIGIVVMVYIFLARGALTLDMTEGRQMEAKGLLFKM